MVIYLRRRRRKTSRLAVASSSAVDGSGIVAMNTSVWLSALMPEPTMEMPSSEIPVASRRRVKPPRLRKPQSFVYNCETGNRRVDVSEFVAWASACQLDPVDAFRQFLDAL